MWHANYINYISYLTDIAQNQYPERLKKVFLLNVPTVFWVTWKIISTFLAQKTIDKATQRGVTAAAIKTHLTILCAGLLR